MGTTYYEGGIIIEHDGETPPASAPGSTRVVPSAVKPGKAAKAAKAASSKRVKAASKGKNKS